jgi:hypothetical protein
VSIAAHVLETAGLSATASLASGTIGTAGAAAGSSQTASTASGSVTALLAVSGLSAATSEAAGAISVSGLLAGSSLTVSGGDGAVTAVLVITGLADTGSAADGWVLPPYIAGLLPDHFTAVVIVEPGARVTISVIRPSVLIDTDRIVAGVTVDDVAADVVVERPRVEVS